MADLMAVPTAERSAVQTVVTMAESLALKWAVLTAVQLAVS